MLLKANSISLILFSSLTLDVAQAELLFFLFPFQICPPSFLYISVNGNFILPIDQIKNLEVTHDSSLLYSTCDLSANPVGSDFKIHLEFDHFLPSPLLLSSSKVQPFSDCTVKTAS